MPPKCSNPLPPRALLVALLLALAPAARAQAPSCAWGDGVAFPGAEGRTLMIAGDGGAGLLAVSVSATGDDPGTTYPHVGSLRLHHVLEQGRLDPAFPPGGVTFFTPPPLAGPNDHPRTLLARVLADGNGGVWVLAIGCNPDLPKLRCFEVEVARLFHVSGSGEVAPGFPAGGIELAIWPDVAQFRTVDMMGDGAHGVVVVWVELTSGVPARTVRAQRFLADGSPVWAGGLAGEAVIAPTDIQSLCLAPDPAGGAVVVATHVVSQTPSAYNYGMLANRLNADGALPWGTLGVPVLDLSTHSEFARDAAVDELGYTFVTAQLDPLTSGAQSLGVQLLRANGLKAWGPFGMLLESVSDARFHAIARQGAYTSMFRDLAGAVRFQTQDEFGNGYWGDPGAGVAATWSNPAQPMPPLRLPEGHLLSLWSATEPDPAVFARAIELDEMGVPVAGWPDTGAVVCGGQSGHVLADALLLEGALYVAFGGSEFSPVTPRVQRMSRAVLDVPRTLPSHAIELAAPVPNPCRGAWQVRFALREGGRVSLEAFDVAGRRVLAEDLGEFAAGPHVAVAQAGAALPAGIYRVRVRSGERRAERTLVRVR